MGNASEHYLHVKNMQSFNILFLKATDLEHIYIVRFLCSEKNT